MWVQKKLGQDSLEGVDRRSMGAGGSSGQVRTWGTVRSNFQGRVL